MHEQVFYLCSQPFTFQLKLMDRLLFFALLSLFVFSCKSEPSGKSWKRSGPEIALRIPAEPTGLNPLLAFDANSTPIQRYLYQFLEDLDPTTGRFEPQLLRQKPLITELDDGRVRYDFEIRPEAVWDDGKPITGYDYLFTLKMVLNPHIQASHIFRPYLDFVDRIEIDSDHPRRFFAIAKEPYILAEEALVNIMPVLPEHLFDPEGVMQAYSFSDLQNPDLIEQFAQDERLKAFAKLFSDSKHNRSPEHLYGSGPYRLLEWQSGERLVFVKKENWWGDALAEQHALFRAYPPRITLKPVKDAAAAAAMLRAEEVDIVDMLDPRDFAEMRADSRLNSIYAFEAPLTLRYYFIYINNQNPKLDDPRVRRALAHLTNVEQIIHDVFYGLGQPVSTPILPGKDYYAEDLTPIPYDVERAKILLSEAGWIDTNGNGIVDKKINGQKVEMKLSLLVTPREASQQLALLIKESAQKAGVEINIETLDFKALRKRLNTRDYELANGALAMQPGLDDLTQLWHTQSSLQGGMNRTLFGSAETDRLIEEINRTFDKQKRDKLYRIFQKMWYEEQPVINIMAARSRIALHRRLDAFTSFVSPGYYPMQYREKQ